MCTGRDAVINPPSQDSCYGEPECDHFESTTIKLDQELWGKGAKPKDEYFFQWSVHPPELSTSAVLESLLRNKHNTLKSCKGFIVPRLLTQSLSGCSVSSKVFHHLLDVERPRVQHNIHGLAAKAMVNWVDRVGPRIQTTICMCWKYRFVMFNQVSLHSSPPEGSTQRSQRSGFLPAPDRPSFCAWRRPAAASLRRWLAWGLLLRRQFDSRTKVVKQVIRRGE